MFRTFASACLVAVVLSAVPAQAADRDSLAAEANALAAVSPSTTTAGSDVDWSLPPVHIDAREASRGRLLPALYVTLAGLNAFDAHSTNRGLARGATEANPVMGGIAGNPIAMWAVKGGVTAGTVFVAERLWRKNRKVEAVAVMLISNGMMATVAARNASVLRQQR